MTVKERLGIRRERREYELDHMQQGFRKGTQVAGPMTMWPPNPFLAGCVERKSSTEGKYSLLRELNKMERI